MKKNIGKILAVILVVALLATVLCACNAESYQKKLEKKGYAVTTATSNDKESTTAWTVTAINKTPATSLLSPNTTTPTMQRKLNLTASTFLSAASKKLPRDKAKSSSLALNKLLRTQCN